MNPLINILIRTSYRPTTFARCIKSITDQTYKNIRVIVSYDDPRALQYIPDWCEKLPVTKSTEPYGYNLYCNDLKAQVKEGWFFFLDDDDRLAGPTVLQELVDIISGDEYDFVGMYIVQFIRGEVVKPITDEVIWGKIGMPCCIVNSFYKDKLNFNEYVDADYTYIQSLKRHAGSKFVPLILVRASRRGHGYVEEITT